MNAFQNFLKEYESAVEFTRMGYDYRMMLSVTFVLFMLTLLSALFIDPTLSILVALVVLDLGIGLPFFRQDQMIEQIEAALPDVLHHMGTTLKTGGTIEAALKEVSKTNRGPITDGLKEVMIKISEGSTFEDAFQNFAIKSKSKMLQKAAIIIVAARKSGGALLETLTAMGEDFRALYRLDRERKTKTFMQFLFLLVAGCIIAPMVFGIVKSVLNVLIGIGGSMTPESAAIISEFNFLFKAYIIVQASLAVIGAMQLREGKFSKSVIYVPFGAGVAYVIYIVVSMAFVSFLGIG